jgi:MFS family permease
LTDPSEDEPSIGYWALIRDYRDWRYLWFGQIVSMLGDWFNLIASASLLAQLTGSGIALGSLFVVRMLAPFLVSPVAGVLIDRYNRRNILIWCDFLRVFIVAGFLLVRTSGDVWLLYTLTALQLAIGGVFFTARRSITPDLVPHRALGVANAIGSATFSVMLALGAAVGGLASGIWGVYNAFAIDTLTFVVSAALILRIRYVFQPAITESDQSIRAALRQYVQGFRYLKKTPDILAISLHKPVLSLFLSMSLEIVQVRIAQNIFPIGQGGSISLGLMYAISGVGSGFGPIVARMFTGDRIPSMRVAIFWGYFISIAGFWIISLLYSFPVVLLGGFVRSFGSGIVWVYSTTLLLKLVPNEVRGRTFSSEHAAFSLFGAIASASAGLLVDILPGLPDLLRWTSLPAIIPALMWGYWIWRRSPK